MKRMLLCGLAAVCLFAQNKTDDEYQTVNVFNASNQLVAVCKARSVVTNGARERTSVAISAASNASPVVFTSTGHGFDANTRPVVTISGGTGNWAAVNGTRTATIVDANSFSVAVDSGAFGAVAGTLVFKTTAPRKTVEEWSVRVFVYDAAGNLTNNHWLKGNARFEQKCSEATSSTLNVQ